MSLDITFYVIRKTKVFDTNITHNLNKMAEEAGIYQVLWRPEEIGINRAGEMIELLEKGIQRMEEDPDHFKKFDAPNGWGIYDDFLPWCKEVLQAYKENPDAEIEISR